MNYKVRAGKKAICFCDTVYNFRDVVSCHGERQLATSCGFSVVDFVSPVLIASAIQGNLYCYLRSFGGAENGGVEKSGAMTDGEPSV